MQITVALRNGIMANIIAEDGILDPAAVFVGVAEAITDNGVDTVIADITPPSGTIGNRNDVATWGTPYNLSDQRRVVDAPAMVFRPASSADGTVLVGWYIADAATVGNLLGFGFFPAPVPLPDENSAVTVILRITVDPLGRWDATVTFNG